MTVAAAAKAGAKAAEMGDFTLSDDVALTIAAGSKTSTGTVTITANPDDDDSDDEEVEVTGTVATTGTVTGPGAKTLTIMDDDAAGGTVTLVLTPDEIKEGEVSTVTATLSAPAPRAFEVTISTALGTATAADFEVSANKRLHFKVGDTESSGSALAIQSRSPRRTSGMPTRATGRSQCPAR